MQTNSLFDTPINRVFARIDKLTDAAGEVFKVVEISGGLIRMRNVKDVGGITLTRACDIGSRLKITAFKEAEDEQKI